MPHSGNWRHFDFSNITTINSETAYLDLLQKVCRHPKSELETEITGRGDDVKIVTICKLCLKTISEE
jgi:hypothetical protein